MGTIESNRELRMEPIEQVDSINSGSTLLSSAELHQLAEEMKSIGIVEHPDMRPGHQGEKVGILQITGSIAEVMLKDAEQSAARRLGRLGIL